MNAQTKWATALIVCLGLIMSNQTHAQRQSNYRSANSAAAMAGDSLASYNTFENSYGCELGSYYENSDAGNSDAGNEVYYEGSSQNCSDGSCYTGTQCCETQCCGRRGQFFVGADYLHIRSTFSESTAYVTRTGGTPTGPDLLPPITNTFHELEYDYEPSYRVYGGYRFCDCGGEIRFAFTQFNSSAAADSGPVPLPSGGQSTQYLYGDELPAFEAGDRIQTRSNVDAKIYDLGFAKTIPLGSPACCGGGGCCDTCCDDSCCDSSCCDSCCWCPAWDIKWSAGLRFADISWDRVANLQTPSNAQRAGETRSTTMDFEGGGARVGLEGTRYLGRRQRFALFAKSDISILLGDVNINYIKDNITINGDEEFTRYHSTQLIPVLDIEAGGTVYVTDCLTISGGYLFSAWHDLGMRDTFDILDGNGPTFDDANILGFDGFFVRSELAF